MKHISRREFLKLSAGAAVGTAVLLSPLAALAAEERETKMKFAENLQVPYCTGRSVPQIAMPQNACDCAHHIFDPVRFPYKPDDVRNQPPAGVDVYRLLQKKLGLTRSVVVQASAYGTDNSCLVDALKQLGRNSRGVAVVPYDVSDNELAALHAAGVRGLRYNVSRGAKLEPGKLLRMADRVKELGWHMAFWVPADIAVNFADLFQKLPVPVVFDHRGHLPAEQGTRILPLP